MLSNMQGFSHEDCKFEDDDITPKDNTRPISKSKKTDYSVWDEEVILLRKRLFLKGTGTAKRRHTHYIKEKKRKELINSKKNACLGKIKESEKFGADGNPSGAYISLPKHSKNKKLVKKISKKKNRKNKSIISF